MLLDGRNRLAACKLAGVEPRIEVYDGDDEGAFVRSSNERRHQSTGSRAMSTALSLQADGLRTVDKTGNGRWAQGALRSSSDLGPNSTAWEKAMRRAGLVLDECPDLARPVIDGEITLREAADQAQDIKDAREAEVRAQAEFEANRARTEQEAQDFFESNQRAGEWYEQQPVGRFDTWQLAKAAYLEHDKQARWEEEKARRAEEERQRAYRDALQRDAQRIKAFLSGYDGAYSVATGAHQEPQAVLDLLDTNDRNRFTKIMEETQWPATRP